jgi:2-polyprenyl-6-methoxyphenol hydroxylase-like FAD-dependent oxidoreductase
MLDAVIVGAGHAGSATALELIRRGFAVTLVERAHFPRRKVCGEYLNAGAVAALERLGLAAAARALGNPLRGLRIVAAGTEPLELRFPAPVLALPRADLDALLLDAALRAGARLVQARAEELVFEGGRVAGVVVRDDAGELQTLRARFVAGADGSGSLVARKLGLAKQSRGTRRFAIGGHYRGFGDLGEFVEMYVGGGAYFALNPLDAERTNVMVVVRDGQLAAWSGAVDDGVRGKALELGRGHRSFANAERIGERVSFGPLAFTVSEVVRPGALLVGDAAGFLNPFTGQGVFLALRGAAEAAATLAAALERPATEALSLRDYARRRDDDLRTRRRLARVVDLLVDVPFLARRATARLRRFPELGDALLGALSGTTGPERALSPALLGRLLV